MKIAPQPAGKPPEHARPRQPALNSLLDVKAWALEPDEGMESTHPALGLAFFNHPAGQAEPGSDAFERHARLLAASLAGEPLAESPDPAWLEGFEESWWAKARQPLAERSMALASVLRERRDIERGLTPTTKRPQSTRRL